MSTDLPVTVAVPAKNMESTLPACIESILRSDLRPREILIVTDVFDATAAVASRYPVKIVLSSSSGIASARNAAIASASQELIAFVDGDCEPDKDWLTNLIRHLEDEQVVAVVGDVILKNDNSIAALLKHFDIKSRYMRQDYSKAIATGPNSAFKVSILRRLGGFNPRIERCEDAELSYRILSKGYRIKYVPEAKVYHVAERGTIRFLIRQMMNARGITKAIWLHMNQGLYDIFIPPSHKFQPPFFILLLVGWLPVLAYPSLLLPYLLALLLGFLMGFPTAVRVSRLVEKPTILIPTMSLFFVRGFAWAFGLILGTLDTLGYVIGEFLQHL